MYQSAELFFHFTTLFILTYTPMGLLVYMCMMCVQVHKEARDIVGSYGTGVIGSCRLPDVNAEDQILSSERAMLTALNPRAITLAHKLCFLISLLSLNCV